MVRISQLIVGKDLEQYRIVRPIRAMLKRNRFPYEVSNALIIRLHHFNKHFEYKVPVFELPITELSDQNVFRMMSHGLVVKNENPIICTTQS